MPNAAIIEIDRTSGKTSFIADINLASIPTKDDKIVINIDSTGFVFNVVDVHYADNQRVDVFVARLTTITDYMTRFNS
jgi:hypothetical protein